MPATSGLILAGTGTAIGIIAALGFTRVIASMLYDVTTTDAVTLTSVVVLLTCVALCAAWLPARRATRSALTEALRLD